MVQIILKQFNRPKEENIDKDIKWFCDSFGLTTGRDTAYSSNKIIVDILNQISENKEVFSEKLSENLELSQNLINHHLRSLINSGIVVRERKQILIRGGSLTEAVKEIRKDALRILDTIETIAEEIDEELGLKNR